MKNEKYLYFDGLGEGGDANISARWWIRASDVVSVIADSNTSFIITYASADTTTDFLTVNHTANVAGNPVAAEQVTQQMLDVQNTAYTNGVAEIKLAGGQTLTHLTLS